MRPLAHGLAGVSTSGSPPASSPLYRPHDEPCPVNLEQHLDAAQPPVSIRSVGGAGKLEPPAVYVRMTFDAQREQV